MLYWVLQSVGIAVCLQDYDVIFLRYKVKQKKKHFQVLQDNWDDFFQTKEKNFFFD